MLKVMIIDDEDIIREGIRDNIPWSENGLEVVAEASDGKDALEILECVVPDIIITDIRMRYMDGLEFIEILRKKYSDIQVIVLSGYDDFEYAKKAIDMHVYKYILKPVSSEELLAVLLKIKENINKRSLEIRNIEEIKNRLKESIPIFREKFFTNLINGRLSEKDIEDRIAFLGIKVDKELYIGCVLNIEDSSGFTEGTSEEEVQLMYFAIKNIIEEIMSSNVSVLAFQEENQFLHLIFSFNNVDLDNKEIMDRVSSFHNYIHRNLKIEMSVGVGLAYRKLTNMSKSIAEAHKALEQKVFFGKNSIMYYSDMPSEINEFAIMNNFDVLILESFKIGNINDIKNYLNILFDEFKKSNCSRNYMLTVLLGVINNIIRHTLSYGVDSIELSIKGFSELEHQINSFTTLDEIKDWFEAYVSIAAELINAKRNYHVKNIVKMAKQYINENYTREDISLVKVAEAVSVTSSYLSKVFKDEAGESYIEYQSKLRIDTAKKLLRNSNQKTYEIAYGVGFSNPHYFSICFKKYVGVAPNEYRNSDIE